MYLDMAVMKASQSRGELQLAQARQRDAPRYLRASLLVKGRGNSGSVGISRAIVHSSSPYYAVGGPSTRPASAVAQKGLEGEEMR